MPELPEVETIRQDLRKIILGKKITQVFITSKANINVSKTKFVKELQNNKFIEIDRVGKLLIFILPQKKYLLIHLKMTGQLIYRQGIKIVAGGHPEPSLSTLPNNFTRVSFNFYSHASLFFNDIRRFGFMKLVDEIGLTKIKQKFGLEPLSKEFTLKYFKQVLGASSRPIKVALLDQEKIAGIGNIYASEVCFEAKIIPNRKVKDLSENELKLLYQACVRVLKTAVKNRGTTFSDYVDLSGQSGYHAKFLKVYDREGKLCKRGCGGIIQKVNLAGRGTFFCKICQK